MNTMIVAYKQKGETPLQVIERFKKSHPDYIDVKITYAGRLDPLACGILVLLTGEKVHEKNNYLDLPKKYTAEFLLGISTDTFDSVGIPKHYQDQELINQDEKIKNFFQSIIGTRNQAYPPYSSKTVQGIPLYVHARQGTLPAMLPTREVTIFSTQVTSITSKTSSELLDEIKAVLQQISGDFRQQEILQAWEKKLNNSHQSWTTVSVVLEVSSGTYIRDIANQLGQYLGVGACLINLERTALGNFTTDDVMF